jgi:hypothetical protein
MPSWIPAASTGGGVDVQEFTSDGTWTKPAGAKMVDVYLVAGGGGGSSGKRGAGDGLVGGDGGGGGGVTYYRILADDLDATESVTVGVGGTGAAARTIDGNSVAGGSGEASYFGDIVCTAGDGSASGAGLSRNLILQSSGSGGPGGSVDNDYGGSSGNIGLIGSNYGEIGILPTGGGGGGGVDGTGTAQSGGSGGGFEISPFINGLSEITGPSGGAAGEAGTIGIESIWALELGGTGGGGGGASASANAGAGGNGGFPGGGGGGGGAAKGAYNSGAGGDGADGYVCVITYC